jgi:hypothetical protein
MANQKTTAAAFSYWYIFYSSVGCMAINPVIDVPEQNMYNSDQLNAISLRIPA